MILKQKKEKEIVPLEIEEAIEFAHFLRDEGLLFTHIPNETRTSSFTQKRKNTLQGVNKGFPDYVIVIPADRSITGKSLLIVVELKRRKGGVLSPEQKVRLKALHQIGDVHCAMAEGAEAAIGYIETFLT